MENKLNDIEIVGKGNIQVMLENGETANIDTIMDEGSEIQYFSTVQRKNIVSEIVKIINV